MPKDKDLKNLVRARMAKTGESYSIAKLRAVGDPHPRKAAKTAKPRPNEAPSASSIYQVKITISEIAPPIWRRLHVPADASLAQLHGPPYSSLHAKCVVVDGARAFVSSANFTQRAQDRNIEVGVLIEDASFASYLAGQWLGLIDAGIVGEYIRPVG